jgi:hypothetical protein
MRLTRLALLTAVFLSGCSAFATKGTNTLKIRAPNRVAVGASYTFQVDVLDEAGQPVPHVHYGWLIDWPEIRGIYHTGASSEPQRMEVKGGAGKALLRVYMKDERGRVTQVDQFEIRVE